MPSKGQPILKFRCPVETLEAIKSYIDARAERDDTPPISMSDFLLQAVVEKLHHADRSKGSHLPRPRVPAPDPGERRRQEGDFLDFRGSDA